MEEVKLKKFINLFKGYSKTKEFEEDMVDRKEREIFFSKLKWQEAQELDEFLFGEIISKLWASGIWTNKDYLVKKIISQNGIEKLRFELWNLLFASTDIAQRYDNFMKEIKGLGPASITELLCLINPKSYGIWNDKARKALKILGFEKTLPLNKYKISGEEYKKFNEILKQISYKLEANGFKDVNLLFVDYFLYEVWKRGELEKPIKEISKTEEDFDHEEIVDQLIKIGEDLGFEAESKKRVGKGAMVDLIWRARIANLGTIIYVFEVQRKGSIDSLIVNLQKAKRNASVQKLIIVSNLSQIEKIKGSIKELSEDFQKSLTFWDVRDVESTYQKLSEIIKSIDKLDLVKDEFELEKTKDFL